MNFLKKMTNFNSAMSVRQGADLFHGRSIGALAVDKAERSAAAFGFGYIKGYYRDRAMVMGQPLDLVAGVGLTALGAVLSMASNGKSALAPHIERVGDAGLASYFNSIGAAMGAKAAGTQVQVVKGLDSHVSILGEIPPAVHGSYLTADEIARYSGIR